MKLKLKRSEFVVLNKVLMDIVQEKNESYDKRFIFGVHRTLEYLEPEIKTIQETQKDSPRDIEFQQKAEQIGMECSDKDENGQPKLTKMNGADVFVIVEKQVEANERMMALREEYKDVIEAKQKILEQLNELLEEEIELEICKVSFAYFPDKYDIVNHKVLKYIIKETIEEIEAKYL